MEVIETFHSLPIIDNTQYIQTIDEFIKLMSHV